MQLFAVPKGVGDPTLLGWVTFGAYFAAAALTDRAARSASAPGRPATRLERSWLTLAWILVLLGFNKQIDLQVWLNSLGRRLAIEGHWYRERYWVQFAFFVAVALGVLLVYAFLLAQAWRHLDLLAGALFGATLLTLFVLVRAISFDVLDLRWSVGGVQMHELVELLGVVLVGVGAARFVDRQTRLRPVDGV